MRDLDLLIAPAVCVPPFDLALRYPESIDGTPARTYFHWLALAYGAGYAAVVLVAAVSLFERRDFR